MLILFCPYSTFVDDPACSNFYLEESKWFYLFYETSHTNSKLTFAACLLATISYELS